MKDFYSLQPSTRMFIVGLVASFLYLFEINPRGVSTTIMLHAFLDAILSLMSFVAIFAFVFGTYRGAKEMWHQIKYSFRLGKNPWYGRSIMISGCLLFFLGALFVFGNPHIPEFLNKARFLALFCYVFFARFVWGIFIRSILGYREATAKK